MIDKSIVIPVYMNEMNIGDLLDALEVLIRDMTGTCEVVFVVDGSGDRSWELLDKGLSERSFSSQLVSHSRNFGSFAAIRTGLHHARGNKIAVMAADLQEPPELLLEFFRILDLQEADIVLGSRTGRSDGLMSGAMSSIFWMLFRKLVVQDMPKGGIDIFACNTMVRDSLLQMEESNSSLIAQIFWVGYRRAFVTYERKKRLKGRSAWTLMRKVRYLFDSIISFTDLPLQILLWSGFLGIILTFALGTLILASRMLNLITVPGYSGIMLTILFFSSIFLLTNGLVGLYLWRIFENTKKRPLSIVTDKRLFSGDQ